DVLCRLKPGLFGLIHDIERVAVEGREAWHPTALGRFDESVCSGAVGEEASSQLRGEAVCWQAVVAPLVGSEVPECGTDHLARRAYPVEPERVLRPTGERANLLLADVMGPAAAILSLATGHGCQSEERAVD